MPEIRKGAVRLKGNPVDLTGPLLKQGDIAPGFRLQGASLEDVTPKDFEGKTRVILSVPSLDTAVCSRETRRFNEEAAGLKDTAILCVSMDLPFAQARWCGAEGIKEVRTLSDHRDAGFGIAYGVLIDNGPLQRLLARAVFVVGVDNRIKYAQYVPEITEEPDYAMALKAIGPRNP